MTIGQRIAELRKQQNLSQEALGELLGVSRQAISKWESDAALPEIDKLIAMSKRFGVTVGYLLGVRFQNIIVSIDHWIAFVLLGMIGFNMIREATGEEENLDPSFSFRAMLPLAVATSIDALAVGVTFAFLQVQIIPAVSFIGITTFLFSALGVAVGARFGGKFGQKAELAGGLILIAMGTKILLEHLGILA